MTADLIADRRVERRRRPSGRRVLKRVLAAVPAAIVGVYVLVAIFGPMLLSFDPVQANLRDRLVCPGCTTSSGGIALLGTDAIGRDMVGQLVYGARTSILVGAITVTVCAVVGVVVGLAAGYFGGAVDMALSRVIDVLIAFPSIVLAIVVAGLFERGIAVVVAALSLAGWVSFARLTRGQTVSLREREWVSAARVMGVAPLNTMKRHVAPFLVGPVLALVALDFGLIVLGEAGLSFLGIGLPRDIVSWGQTIASGKEYLGTAWWISAFPGAALALLVVMVGLLADQLNARYQKAGSR